VDTLCTFLIASIPTMIAPPCAWIFIALGLPVTTKRGVLLFLKCH
jgi:hypothetical protein